MDMFQTKNFSNAESGILLRLRMHRNNQYADAFTKFKKDGDKDRLVTKLKQIVEDKELDAKMWQARKEHVQGANRYAHEGVKPAVMAAGLK